MYDEFVDVKENTVIKLDYNLLSILLYDHSSKKNIIWATDNYSSKGIGYQYTDEIKIEKITGKLGQVIKPRIKKSKQEQLKRSKDKAEVFTPSWICNIQNNLIDKKWFGEKNVFNYEIEHSWKLNENKIEFPTKRGKNWNDYVNDIRLEITCGEAPYIVSRYDTVTGQILKPRDRIGLLDRKIRVINENAHDDEWVDWVKKAYKSIYAYEWQGDSVLIARENLLYTFIDYYEEKFNQLPNKDLLIEIAIIISWNIWQMDGLKYVVPCSCHNKDIIEYTLFGENVISRECIGCKKNKKNMHNGIYCKIMNWKTNRKIKFISLIK